MTEDLSESARRVQEALAAAGISVQGHDSPIQTLMDEDLLRLETIWAAAGTPHAVFSVEPRQLVQATGGRVVPVAVSSQGA